MQGSKKMYIYIVISFILASAFCLSSFATDSLSLNDSQFSLIWNASSWNYFGQTVNGASSSSHTGVYRKYYMFDNTAVGTDYNGLAVYGRQLSFGHLNTSRIRLSVPMSLTNLDSFSSDFFIGLWSQYDYSYRPDLISQVDFTFGNASSSGNYFDIITYNNNYIFGSSDRWKVDSESYRMRRYHLTTNAVTISRLVIDIYLTEPLPYSLTLFVGMASDTEIGAQDGQSQAIIGGLSGIQGGIDNLVTQLEQSDGQILDELGNVLYELEGDSVTAAEAEKMVDDSVTQGEKLEELGNAISNVDKPQINNVINVTNPNLSLGTADASLIQLALSSIYSWDKFVSILGIAVAVVTLSYILFGKKK